MKSMTGFGAVEQAGKRGKIQVEARSYNNRFLDVKLKLARPLQSFEPKIFLWAKERFVRGRIEFSVQWRETNERKASFQLNQGTLDFYLDLEKRLRDDFGVPGSMDMSTLVGLRDFIESVEDPVDMEEEWPDVFQALEGAADKLEEAQQGEGKAIQVDLLKRIDFLLKRLDNIKATAQGLPEQYRKMMEERLAQLMPEGGQHLDPQRIAQEIVIYSDKIDITEEIVRLASHLEVCKKAFIDETMRGKRLDFLAQEIHRELNTIGSKSQHTEIIYHVVDMKTELEKIREQAQNLQ